MLHLLLRPLKPKLGSPLRSISFAVLFSLIFLEVLAQATENYLKSAGRSTRVAPQSVLNILPSQLEVVGQICRNELRYHRISASLGWDIRPNGVSPLYLANTQGIRAPHDYTPEMGSGHRRFIIMGDSYTHGDEVEYGDTWGAKLADRTGSEVINLGVPGYGPDQALLRYGEFADTFEATDVLFGIMTENPYRLLNSFRPFINGRSNHPMSKPRFVLEGEGLRLIPPLLQSTVDYCHLATEKSGLLPELGAFDYRYQRYHPPRWIPWFATTRLLWETRALLKGDGVMVPPRRGEDKGPEYDMDGEGLQILTRLLGMARRVTATHGSRMVVVIFPGPEALKNHQKFGGWLHEPLTRWLKLKGFSYIDVGPGLVSQKECEILGVSHYAACANTLVATQIAQYYAQSFADAP